MRLEKLDILRGVAILLMVIFHINYSLVNIFSNNLLNFSEYFWFLEGRISALLFIFISGVSFFLAEEKYGNQIIKKYIKISIILGIISGGISISTFLFLPEQYIRFGIIHFFTLSFILLLFFRKFKYYNILFGFIFVIYGFYFIPVIANRYFYYLGFLYPGFSSADYYPIFPYFGIMLFGYTLALFLKNKSRLDIFVLKHKNNITSTFLRYIGKKSLIIYLIHQPIIITILYFIYYGDTFIAYFF